MRSHHRLPVALTAILLAALACNLPQATPTADPNVAYTAAAQTVAAQLTQSALTLAAPTATGVIPPPTNTNIPTLPPPTIVPSATTECDRAQFVSDVTIPDGKKMSPGEAFTKTWRLRNIGSCTWSGYSLVFDTGNSMNGPASSAIANTPPGGTVDISVNLTAPAAPGSYRGYWRIRNVSGYLLPVTGGYQGKSFYVDIKVESAPVSLDLPYLPSESGLVTSGGGLNALTVAAGDSVSNQGVEAFLSFDISGVPAGATIQTASLRLIGGGQVRGDPFGGLGCMRAYVHNYGVVDVGDFTPPGAPGGFASWCSAAEVSSPFTGNALILAVQSRVGSTRFQIRLQFRDALTDGDGVIDDVLIIAPVFLTVTYTAP